MNALDRAIEAAGEVAATMESDVRHVLSERALEDVVRAVLMAVRVNEPVYMPEERFNNRIDAILADGG